MGFSNVALRGSSYWWRKKMTVAGVQLTLALPIGAMSFKDARVIALRLGSVAETLRMGYGQSSSGVSPDQLKRVFSDALRWQLQRILEDQCGSQTPAGDHATMNSLHAEAWSFLSRHGIAAKWTLDEYNRLVDSGWSPASAKAIGNLVFNLQTGVPVSHVQMEAYVNTFGIASTDGNLDKMRRTVCAANAAACREATAHLLQDSDVAAAWIEDALMDDAPLAWETPSAPAGPSPHLVQMATEASEPAHTSPNPDAVKPKKRLLDAAEECIAAYEREKAWSADTMKQVRTAIRLFDYACGGDVHIEDVGQRHVSAFIELCHSLPNRWGRTKAEQAGGIAASLERATTMPADELGTSQDTINKHITWITSVLKHAAGATEAEGHRPAQPITFETARQGVGKKNRRAKKRDRDKRINWTKEEVRQLLSAPMWTGSAGIDKRFKAGDQIIHDAWYWLPLMLPLYGGRSSELAGLALTEVHEDEPIPYFLIDYTEDRPLKNVQSVRKLPIHPELIRLGFIEYIRAIRAANCRMLFPEMNSPNAKTFASTFYKSIFEPWRTWAFPEGTSARRRVRGAWKDKDVHSFRGTATSMLKGLVQDSVRCDIFGHEGDTETARTYDDEAELSIKLDALKFTTPFTQHINANLPVRIRPKDRLRHGVRTPRQKSRLGKPQS